MMPHLTTKDLHDIHVLPKIDLATLYRVFNGLVAMAVLARYMALTQKSISQTLLCMR